MSDQSGFPPPSTSDTPQYGVPQQSASPDGAVTEQLPTQRGPAPTEQLPTYTPSPEEADRRRRWPGEVLATIMLLVLVPAAFVVFDGLSEGVRVDEDLDAETIVFASAMLAIAAMAGLLARLAPVASIIVGLLTAGGAIGALLVDRAALVDFLVSLPSLSDEGLDGSVDDAIAGGFAAAGLLIGHGLAGVSKRR